MSKTLLVGHHPPRLIKGSKIEAGHYRTWQFLQPLLDDAHEVLLCSGAQDEAVNLEPIPDDWAPNLRHQPIRFGRSGWRKALQEAHDRFDPDCIVAVNFSHCLYATGIRTTKPLWMDIYGDMMTIMQAACYRQGSDRGLATTTGFMRQILKAGDVFSGCGVPQQHLLVGQLSLAGRLNSRTFGYEFTRVVLPGASPASGHVVEQAGELDRARGRRRRLAAYGVDEDAFVVLWCGGYNTWTDVTTLFRGIEEAMRHQPRLRYVSVGANTYEAADNTYDEFQRMVEGSSYRDRFVLLGWRPWAEIADWYAESDVGLNIDALHYETIYGTRTRLVEMIASGLPVVTTRGAELSYVLQQHGAALTFAIGDWRGLSEHLERLIEDEGLLDELRQASTSCAQQQLSFAATTQPLREWVGDPSRAPDRGPLRSGERFRRLEYSLRANLRHALWRWRGAHR